MRAQKLQVLILKKLIQNNYKSIYMWANKAILSVTEKIERCVNES